jgi:hypothetical protein
MSATHTQFAGGPRNRGCPDLAPYDGFCSHTVVTIQRLPNACSAGSSDPSPPQGRVINIDKARFYGAVWGAVKAEGTLCRRCRHRPVQCLNNILEQDH